MSDIIQLLPDSVANQIKAGEVVQRPASVIKELVENAIDAGADIISINLKDAGKTLIQVIDNGCGMSDTDARMAFEPHATSKISKADDLFNINTMGFRGEALGSIAAVAEVELCTKKHDAEIGSKIIIRGGDFIKQECTACSEGSTFNVKNLFYNVPARRKFLKSDKTELRKIIEEFNRIALTYPELNFTLVNDDKVVTQLTKANLKQRIINVFGKRLNNNLVKIETTTSIASIYGYIGNPEHAKTKYGEQFFFVNGRFMKHPYFHKAVMNAYDKLITPGSLPSYFIYFKVDPSILDVNIHPTKTEIKFQDEPALFQIINAIVRETFGKFNIIPSIDFDEDNTIEIPTNDFTNTDYKPTINLNPNYNPFQSNKKVSKKKQYNPFSGASSTTYRSSISPNVDSFENIDEIDTLKAVESLEANLFAEEQGEEFSQENNFESIEEAKAFENLDKIQSLEENGTNIPEETIEHSTFKSKLNTSKTNKLDNQIEKLDNTTFKSKLHRNNTEQQTQISSFVNKHKKSGNKYLQIKKRYIVSHVKSGMMIIDQKRAFERIQYESFLKSLENHRGASQRCLYPETIELNTQDCKLIESMIPALNDIGFDITPFGRNTYAINGIPAELTNNDSIPLIERLIQYYHDTNSNIRNLVMEDLAISLAKAASVNHICELSTNEISNLIDSLFASSNPNLTPDGKSIITILDINHIKKLL